MSDLYRLVGIGNAELVAGLSKLVQQSNALTAQLLAHLVELDERRLHLELGFSSLFAYCVEGLKMSEGTAGRRVTAARVCRRFPDAFERVARAELHLCALCALGPHLKEQNATELFEVCKGKTRRQIEELLAARFPRPDVREQIRRLPPHRQESTLSATPEGAHGSVERASPPASVFDALCGPRDSGISFEGAERRVEEHAVAARENAEIIANFVRAHAAVPAGSPRVQAPVTNPRPRPRARELEPLSAGRFGVHFTADAELRDLIERARALASHQIPKGDLAALMKLIVTRFVKQEEKRRFGIGTKPRRVNGGANASTSSEQAVPPRAASGHAGQAAPPPDRASGRTKPAAPPGGAPGASETPSRAARPKSPGVGPHSRYLRAQVRREIHARDGGQCAYVSPDGRRCNARAFIQFDHLDPFAQGGASDAVNLRLLCQPHNLLHARNCFGNAQIAKRIATRNCRSSRP